MRPILALLIATTPALADDFITPAPVSSATVYPQGATVTRQATVDLPAGQHRILFPLFQGDVGRITADSVAIGAIERLGNFITDAERVYSEAQSNALAAFNTAKDVVDAINADIAKTTDQRDAFDAQITFFRSVTADGLATLDPDTLRGTGAVVVEQLQQAFTAKQDAQAQIDALQDRLVDAEKSMTQAGQDFARLTPPQGPVDMLAVTVIVTADQTVTLNHESRDPNAYWTASYDIDMTDGTGSGTDPAVSIARKLTVQNTSQLAWSDINLTLSTADPSAQIAPVTVPQDQARLFDPQTASRAVQAEADAGAMFEKGATASFSTVEDIAQSPVAQMQIQGDTVTYVYPTPVTIAGGAATLALDTLTLDAALFNRAAPRFDATAFRMARFTNTTAEPILPGAADLSRDGVFIGAINLPQIPAGAENELAFGPHEGLRLSYTALRNNTGDRGFITTSSTRQQVMEFSVENLTDTPETVETIFALPYSEQEDLDITATATPAPGTMDFNQLRNVGLWSLDIAPGETQTVEIDVQMDWPEGQQLQWQP